MFKLIQADNAAVHEVLRKDPHPAGSEPFVLHTLQLLCEQGDPPAALIDIALQLYRRTNQVWISVSMLTSSRVHGSFCDFACDQNVRYLIPVLSKLSKEQLPAALPKLIDLPDAIMKHAISKYATVAVEPGVGCLRVIIVTCCRLVRSKKTASIELLWDLHHLPDALMQKVSCSPL